VGNGVPFTVGDGVKPAVFILDGGTHSFADGLVISPNAVVTGCGTIVGSVINNGGTLTVSNCSSSGTAPQILQQPTSITVTQGATATFMVVASGDAPLSYEWRRGSPGVSSTNVPGETSATLTITNARAADAGTYHVVVTNPSGSTTSSVAMLRVLLPTRVEGLAHSDSGLAFRFATITNLNYTVEFKNTLNDLTWTPLQMLGGTGDFLSFTNSTTNAMGFFRVRVE
jgi:hypothetical protein